MSETRQEGFALIQIVLVVGVIAIFAGLTVDGSVGTSDVARMTNVQSELATVQAALESYYADHGTFPSSLDAVGFYGIALQPGARDDFLRDEWALCNRYRLVTTGTNPDVVVVYSTGENGNDDGFANEDLKVTVDGRGPGDERTKAKLALIAEVVRQVNAGTTGYTSGAWKGLITSVNAGHELDAYGTAIRIDSDGHTVRSAGADRTFSTNDDLTRSVSGGQSGSGNHGHRQRRHRVRHRRCRDLREPCTRGARTGDSPARAER